MLPSKGKAGILDQSHFASGRRVLQSKYTKNTSSGNSITNSTACSEALVEFRLEKMAAKNCRCSSDRYRVPCLYNSLHPEGYGRAVAC